MTSIGELDFSWIGFSFQFAALLAESGRLVLTNILMKQLKLDPLSTLYYIAPMCLCFITLAFLLFEFQSFPFERFLSWEFNVMLLLNGLVAFTLNIAVVMLIGNTSALMLTLAGIVKDLMLVGLSMVVFQSPVTLIQYMGYSVALLGLNLHKEFKKLPSSAHSTPDKLPVGEGVEAESAASTSSPPPQVEVTGEGEREKKMVSPSKDSAV